MTECEQAALATACSAGLVLCPPAACSPPGSCLRMEWSLQPCQETLTTAPRKHTESFHLSLNSNGWNARKKFIIQKFSEAWMWFLLKRKTLITIFKGFDCVCDSFSQGFIKYWYFFQTLHLLVIKEPVKFTIQRDILDTWNTLLHVNSYNVEQLYANHLM